MIELILQAERAMAVGMLDQAERLYRQAADIDPRNSIAVVGLARVLLDRGDDRGALDLTRKALAIDPENVAAQRLAARLEEVLQFRGEERSVPEPVGSAKRGPVATLEPEPERPPDPTPEPGPPPPSTPAPTPTTTPTPQAPRTPEVASTEPASPPRRSLLDRLLRRR